MDRRGDRADRGGSCGVETSPLSSTSLNRPPKGLLRFPETFQAIGIRRNSSNRFGW